MYEENNVIQDVGGRSRFFTGIFTWMFIGILITALTSYGLVATGLGTLFLINPILIWVFFIAEFVLVFYISKMLTSENMSSSRAKIAFAVYSIVNGVTWIKHSRGWSAVSSGSDIYLVRDGTTTDAGSTKPYVYDDNVGEGYKPGMNSLFNNVNSNISDNEFVKMKNIAGVFGLPYQFMPNTDLRLTGDSNTENIGYEYAERIVERMPVLFLTPGKPNFMTKFSKNERKNVLEKAISAFGNIATSSLDDLLKNVDK